jgi:hypothetical protein
VRRLASAAGQLDENMVELRHCGVGAGKHFVVTRPDRRRSGRHGGVLLNQPRDTGERPARADKVTILVEAVRSGRRSRGIAVSIEATGFELIRRQADEA